MAIIERSNPRKLDNYPLEKCLQIYMEIAYDSEILSRHLDDYNMNLLNNIYRDIEEFNLTPDNVDQRKSDAKILLVV